MVETLKGIMTLPITNFAYGYKEIKIEPNIFYQLLFDILKDFEVSQRSRKSFLLKRLLH